MRVYLAATLTGLRDSLARGVFDAPLAYAVTPAMREWYVEGDAEQLEYAAMGVAARASLAALAGAAVPSRRVVVAADIADEGVRPAPDVNRAAVRLVRAVTLAEVMSAHVDGTSAEDDVRRAAQAFAAAEAGDEDAAFLVDAADDHELAWYDVQELAALVAPET